MSGKARVASLSFVIALALLAAAPAHAADSKLDPDPKLLPKARTLATAKVDQNFDLPSDKTPFSIRFGICVVQLTAIRDEGRALPAPRADLDKVIADYRALAIELKAYSAKISAAEAQKAVDTELEKAAPDTLKFAREDATALGVTVRTARNTDRLLACQLTKDWYAAQNGLAAPVAAAEQAKVAVLNEQQRAAEKAAAPKPPELPYPPAIKPSVVKPTVVATAPAAPAAPAIPAALSFIPPPGTPAGGDDARDARVGSDIADARARAEFSGRPMWSAMVECIGRMELVQTKGGGSAKVQIDGYIDTASSLAKLDRGVDQAAASALVARERERLRPRVAAKWDADYARMRQLPWGEWGLMCYGLQQHATAYINAKNNAAYQKYLADFQRQRQLDNERSLANSATTSSGGGYYAPSSSGDNGAPSRREHEATMQRFKQDTQKIRDDIKAIDRKYR
jgi:hypothetical protein